MSCLADEVVAAWLDGALAEQERAMAIEHTSGCDPCRELVGAMFDSERVPVTIGRYEVVGSIGGGGMGVVLRGRDPVLDRSVAIKLARVGAGRSGAEASRGTGARSVESSQCRCGV